MTFNFTAPFFSSFKEFSLSIGDRSLRNCQNCKREGFVTIFTRSEEPASWQKIFVGKKKEKKKKNAREIRDRIDVSICGTFEIEDNFLTQSQPEALNNCLHNVASRTQLAGIYDLFTNVSSLTPRRFNCCTLALIMSRGIVVTPDNINLQMSAKTTRSRAAVRAALFWDASVQTSRKSTKLEMVPFPDSSLLILHFKLFHLSSQSSKERY